MRCLLLLPALALVAGCNTPTPGTGDSSTLDSGPEDASVRSDASARTCFGDDDCNDGVYCNGAESCVDGYCAREPVECDDGIACTEDLCSEISRRCSSRAPDTDDDGFGDRTCLDLSGVALGTDCDDTDPTVFPGNPEICNLRDEDCDPTTLGGGDTDGDGAVPTACCNADALGVMTCGRDCDDGDPSISQLATEICDAIDNDCDGSIDERSQMMSWPDVDLDGYGDASAMPEIVCTVPSSRANQGGDCDDGDPLVRPLGAERCNGTDDDCDGMTDEGASTACGVAGSLMECVAGACVVTGCDALHFDCNGAASDGCEASLCDTSAACGVCGVDCGSGARLCAVGQCALTVDLLVDLPGLVRDADTGAAIAGATVTSVDVCPAVAATTAADGTYRLTVRDHARPRWVLITRAGYPPHVQPVGGTSALFPSTTVDAWRADPDRNATSGPTRAILVMEGTENPEALHGNPTGPGNGATGTDLSPFTGFDDRVVFLGARPGRMQLGGTVDLGGGCRSVCSPAIDLWLVGGAVTHILDGFTCGAVC